MTQDGFQTTEGDMMNEHDEKHYAMSGESAKERTLPAQSDSRVYEAIVKYSVHSRSDA